MIYFSKSLSLVEVLVCTAILGLLATLVMPLVEIDQIHGSEDELKKYLTDTRYALSEYYRDNYEYPCVGDIIAEINRTNSQQAGVDRVNTPQTLKDILENALMVTRYKDRDRSAMDYDIQSGRMKPYDMPGKFPCNTGGYNAGNGELSVRYGVTTTPMPIGSKLLVHVTKSNATIPSSAPYHVFQGPFEAWYEGHVYKTGIIDLDASTTKLFFTNLNDTSASADDASATIKTDVRQAIDSATYTIDVYEFPRAPQYLRGSAYTEHYLDPEKKGFFHNPYSAVLIQEGNDIQMDFRDQSWKDWEVGIQTFFYNTVNGQMYTSVNNDTAEIIYYAIGSELNRTVPNWDVNFPSIDGSSNRSYQDQADGTFGGATAGKPLTFYNMQCTIGAVVYHVKHKIVDIRYPCIDESIKDNSDVRDFQDSPSYFTSYFQGLTDLSYHKVINVSGEFTDADIKYLWDL